MKCDVKRLYMSNWRERSEPWEGMSRNRLNEKHDELFKISGK
jgi:hypothetical protein